MPPRITCPVHGAILRSHPGHGSCPTPEAQPGPCAVQFPDPPVAHAMGA